MAATSNVGGNVAGFIILVDDAIGGRILVDRQQTSHVAEPGPYTIVVTGVGCRRRAVEGLHHRAD